MIDSTMQNAVPALEAWLAADRDAGSATVHRFEPLGGGAIQENWILEASLDDSSEREELVLRTDASTTIDDSLSRVTEYALLTRARNGGVTVPEPRGCCTDLAVIGRPFFLMRRVPGTAAAHRIVRDDTLGGDRSVLARRLGSELGRIHALEISPEEKLVRPPSASRVAAFVDESRRWLDAAGVVRPAVEWALRWLEREAPAQRHTVFSHRDFRTGNYMVDEQGLTAVLDWEFAGFSDPLEDIGWFCARCWRFGADAREAGGIGARGDFYAGYEAENTHAIAYDEVYFWEVLAHARWAVIALRQAMRARAGERGALLLGLTRHILPELEHELMSMTGTRP